MRFAPDLARDLAHGDANYLALLDAADAYAAREGLDLPEEPAARAVEPDPPCVTDPILQLDLRDAGITAIIWATGFALDFGWLQGRRVRRNAGRRCIGAASPMCPGCISSGCSWLSRRASSFIFGVEHDAAHLAEHIAARA